MVALIAKEQKKAESLCSYIKYALANILIDMDGEQAYALVPSQHGSFKYKVLFDEPANEVPYATDCSCYDHRANHNVCKHMHIVELYYEMIYSIHTAPAVSPEDVEMSGNYSASVSNMTDSAPNVTEDVSAVQHIANEQLEWQIGRYKDALEGSSFAYLAKLSLEKGMPKQRSKKAHIWQLVARRRNELDEKDRAELSTSEQRERAPLNGNRGFSLMR